MKIILFLLVIFFIANTTIAQDTIPNQEVRVDTVIVEKHRVDTVYLPLKEEAQPQALEAEAPQQDTEKPNKVYKGGYVNLSFGKYTVIGIEPLIAFKLLPKLSVGAKISYEYYKNKNQSPTREGSNYGIGAFSRLRIAKRFYAHIEYSEMNYKLYDSDGDSNRRWISFLYLGGGISLPLSKKVSLNAEVLWDLLQEDNSPYSTVEPFINVGIVAGF